LPITRRIERLEVRVILLIRSLDIGGAERQTIELARSLKWSGVPVEVVTFYSGGELECELQQANIPHHALGKTGRSDVFRFVLRLLRLLRERRPSAVYGFMASSNIMLALLKPVLRGAGVIWGVRASNVATVEYDLLTQLTYRVEAALSHRADLIIANSSAGKHEAISKGFPAENFVVIPNGIDTKRFRFDAEGRRRVRAELGIDDNEKLIGLAARLDSMKDHSNFIRAASMLAARVPGLRFVCVGNGPESYRAQLRALSARLGVADRFSWSQGRTDMPAVYSAFDINCSSSAHGEGFSNAVAEAMACERLCVVTDVGDSAFIVAGTGEKVPPRDPEALALAVERLLKADMAKMGLLARQRILENFDVPDLGRRTLAALAQLQSKGVRRNLTGD